MLNNMFLSNKDILIFLNLSSNELPTNFKIMFSVKVSHDVTNYLIVNKILAIHCAYKYLCLKPFNTRQYPGRQMIPLIISAI